MKTNKILDEIYRGREKHARECGHDIQVMFARMRAHLAQLEAQGWKIVSPEPRKPKEISYVLHDQPVKKKRAK